MTKLNKSDIIIAVQQPRNANDRNHLWCRRLSPRRILASAHSGSRAAAARCRGSQQHRQRWKLAEDLPALLRSHPFGYALGRRAVRPGRVGPSSQDLHVTLAPVSKHLRGCFLEKTFKICRIKQQMQYQILLFYKYVHIENPKQFVEEQRKLCEQLGLKGRILIAHEGINGTLEGTTENTEKYMAHMVADPRFVDIHWKKSVGIGDAFPRLRIRLRKEIVTTNITDVELNPAKETATHLKPEELHEWYREGKKFKVIDMRNTYEIAVGTFKDSVDPETMNFRDLPNSLEKLKVHKDETIVTVCTGGVRCEKASQYLRTQGFKDVYQLDGGIVTYMEKYPGQDFEGTLYVFDKRKTMDFSKPGERKIIGKCSICDNTTERVENCADDICHLQFVCCDDCVKKYNGLVYCKVCGNTNGENPKNGNRVTPVV